MKPWTLTKRSRSSRRRVPTRLSQIAFMRGAWTPVRKILVPLAWNTASNEAMKFEVPEGTCATDDCRCSVCWSRAGLPHDAVEPKLYEAFTSNNLRPASATLRGRKRSEDQLDKLVWQLLWNNYSGLVENIIWAVVRGEDHYYSRAEGKRKRLWPMLLLSRVRGRKPALHKDELRASLQRLIGRGEVAQVGACRYRLGCYVLQDQARTAAEAARIAEEATCATHV